MVTIRPKAQALVQEVAPSGTRPEPRKQRVAVHRRRRPDPTPEHPAEAARLSLEDARQYDLGLGGCDY